MKSNTPRGPTRSSKRCAQRPANDRHRFGLGNEVYFRTASPTAQQLFRDRMKAKYGSIARANAAWSSSCDTFAQIVLPNAIISGNNYPDDLPRELYYEFMRWTEEHYGRALDRIGAEARSLYPGQRFTVQSQCGYFRFPIGVIPRHNVRGMDIYGDERGVRQKDGHDAATAVNNLPFHYDLVRAASCHLPIINEEGPYTLSAPGLSTVINTPFVNLHTTWSFRDDAGKVGEDQRWFRPDLDDNDWDTIRVPGIWGQHGFPDTTTGWYRITVKVPPAPGRVYLVAETVCDDAWLWVNGKLMHKPVATWNEGWNVDITDLLGPDRQACICVKVVNTYRKDGFVWGGIRGAITITDRKLGVDAGQVLHITREHLKLLCWSAAIHGYSGWSPWQWYPDVPLRERSIPGFADFKTEFESVASVVGPRPRIRGTVGLYFPYADLRTQLFTTFAEQWRSPLYASVAEAYYALCTSHVPLDVIEDERIQRGQLPQYKALVFHTARRVPTGTVEHLGNWVRSGGTLILNYGSLSFDDDRHARIPAPAWFGVKPGAARTTPQTVRFADAQAFSVERRLDSTHGVVIDAVADDVEIPGRFEDGGPAVTVSRFGRGRVCYVGVSLRPEDLSALYRRILADRGIRGPIGVTRADGTPALHVEVQRVAQGDRQLWYVANWQNTQEHLRVALAEDLAGGPRRWRLRNVSDGSHVAAKPVWTEDELRAGFDVALPPFSVCLFLLERSDRDALEIRQLPPAVRTFVDDYEKLSLRNPPHPRARVLLHKQGMLRVGTMPTAVWLLQNFGYEVNQHAATPTVGDHVLTIVGDERRKEQLADYDVVVIPGNAVPPQFLSKDAEKDLVAYVQKGGSLLYCGSPRIGWWHYGNRWAQRLASQLGITLGDYVFRHAERHTIWDHYVIYPVDGTHPVLRGVSTFFGSGESEARLSADGSTSLIAAPGGTVLGKRPAEGRPIMVAGTCGQGKVVVINGARWLRPDDLWRGENARLLLNAVDWLAGVARDNVSEAAVRAAVDCRAALQAVDPELDWR